MDVYADDTLVERLTLEGIEAAGSRLLQIDRFHPDDDEHIASLLCLFEIPMNATVLDVGCGVGETARLMHLARPDLKFVLSNVSQAQLDMCPDFPKVLAPAESLPVERGDVDHLMVTYALGHFDLPLFAQQAMRILPTGGRLFIFDLFNHQSEYYGALHGEPKECRLAEDLNYAERTIADVVETFRQHRLNMMFRMDCCDALPQIEALMPHPNTLDGSISAVLVFEKE